MELISIIIAAFITIFSLGLFGISLASYKRHKNTKLLFIALVFLVFLIKGMILSIGLFIEEIGELVSGIQAGVFDIIVLAFLFIATLRR